MGCKIKMKSAVKAATKARPTSYSKFIKFYSGRNNSQSNKPKKLGASQGKVPKCLQP